MKKMEGKSQSGGSNSGGVVKNRSSSGCLVIKKKVDGGSGASPGPGPSSDRKVYESKKAKKRARASAGDSGSSDEELLEYYRREGGGLVGSGSAGYNDYGDLGFGRNRLMREGAMKRSKLDVYDFDEYDDLNDVEMMGARYFFEREMGGGSERPMFSPRMEMKSGSGSGDGMDFEGGSSKGDIIYKRRKSFHGSTSGDYYSSNRNERPISMGKERFGGSDEAIRLQGKNGVLKVRVKNKEEATKKHPQMYRPMGGNSVIHRGQELTAKSIIIQRHSSYSERKLPKKPTTAGRADKKLADKRKSWPGKSSEESDEESEDDHASAKFQSGSVKGRQANNNNNNNKRGRKAGNLQSPENSQIPKAREGKVKRGSGTEKQLLREKIRSMLISAGWTIDYRPRRGRDYSDAVYINPTGTAFWSIIKAYDALQKQLEEEGKILKASEDSSSLAPISEDTLSKLTRQTRKKIEKELKRKKREENGAKKSRTNRNFEEDESDEDSSGSGRPDEKLSSYMKRSGKPYKSSSKDAWRDVSRSNRKMQEMDDKSSSRFIHGRKSNKIGRCTLLVRNSEKGHDFGSDGFVPYTGKRNTLSWLIDSGTVDLSEKVHYMNRRRTRAMLEGWITRDGIHCGCCSKILTVTKFEIHAGSKLRQPFQNIYLNSGPSLLQCQVDTWNKQKETLRDGFNRIDVDGDDSNDDTCAICGDGGNLICCDSCPSTFHQSCLDIQVLPAGDWHCPHCSCKFCGLAYVGSAEGYDTKEDISFACSLCERKYHNSCVEMDTSSISNNALPFCGRICYEMFEKLQKLLGVKHELEDGLCWSLIHRTDLSSENSVRSLPQRVEWNSKLAVALSIMDECFLPITDRRSGINMIHNVLYNCGSNFTRLNYKGFYTAVLERSDEIISAASIRIHGTQFAEMPFIGTRHIYRRQGMCRRLFSAIESSLRSLNVEKLIIPAISELMDTWTRVFGFSALEESDKREMKTLNMLVFPGTDMLLKTLVDQDGFENDLKGVDACDAAHNPSDEPDRAQTSDLDSSSGPSIATTSHDGAKVNDNSFNSHISEDMVISVQGTSSEACQHVTEQVNPASHNNSANCSEEATPGDPGEEGQGITVSPLQSSMKLKESAEHVNDHITSDTKGDIDVPEQVNPDSEEGMPVVPGEEGQGITDSSLRLSMNLKESTEHVNDHITSDTKEDIDVPEEAMPVVPGEEGQGITDSSLQSSMNLKESTEHATDHINSDVREDIGVPENALDNSAEMMGNGLPMNDKSHNYDSLSLNAQSSPSDKLPSEEANDDFSFSDTTALIPGERSEGTTHSPLESVKLESSENLKAHLISKSEDIDIIEKQDVSVLKIMGNGFLRDDASQDDVSFDVALPVVPGEGIGEATNACPQLDIKLKESAEASMDVGGISQLISDVQMKDDENVVNETSNKPVETPVPADGCTNHQNITCDEGTGQPISEGESMDAENVIDETSNDPVQAPVSADGCTNHHGITSDGGTSQSITEDEPMDAEIVCHESRNNPVETPASADGCTNHHDITSDGGISQPISESEPMDAENVCHVSSNNPVETPVSVDDCPNHHDIKSDGCISQPISEGEPMDAENVIDETSNNPVETPVPADGSTKHHDITSDASISQPISEDGLMAKNVISETSNYPVETPVASNGCTGHHDITSDVGISQPISEVEVKDAGNIINETSNNAVETLAPANGCTNHRNTTSDGGIGQPISIDEVKDADNVISETNSKPVETPVPADGCSNHQDLTSDQGISQPISEGEPMDTKNVIDETCNNPVETAVPAESISQRISEGEPMDVEKVNKETTDNPIETPVPTDGFTNHHDITNDVALPVCENDDEHTK